MGFLDKLNDIAGKVGDSVNDIAGKVGDSVEKGYKSAKESAKKASDKSQIKRDIKQTEAEITAVYVRIGKKYCELNASSADSNYAEMVNEIKEKSAKVETLKSELALLEEKVEEKAVVCPKCGAAIEGDSKFCAKCGALVEKPVQQPVVHAVSEETSAPTVEAPQAEEAAAPTVETVETAAAEVVGKVCPECGAAVTEDQKFCEKCGKNLAE